MSTQSIYTQSGLHLKVTSAQQSCTSADGREWHIAVEADLWGTTMHSSELSPLVFVKTKNQSLQIRQLEASVSPFAAVYVVKEKLYFEDQQQDLEVEVMFRPEDLFKLDPGLAEIVGCTYLQRPKYALSLVLAYVRANDLQKEKSVVCDETLQKLLGLPCHVRTVELWTWIQKLVHKVDFTPIKAVHRLEDSDLDLPMSSHISTDKQFNILEDNCSLESVEHNVLDNLAVIQNYFPVGFKTPRAPASFLNPTPATFKTPKRPDTPRKRPDTPRKLATQMKHKKGTRRTFRRH